MKKEYKRTGDMQTRRINLREKNRRLQRMVEVGEQERTGLVTAL